MFQNDPRYVIVRDPALPALMGCKPVQFNEQGEPVTLTPQRPTILLRTTVGGDFRWWFLDIDQKVIAEMMGDGP